MRRLAFIAGLLIALATALSAARAEGDAEKGRELAVKHCARCHVVGDHNPHGSIGSTPSFRSLVNWLPDYRERFRTFFARRPHPVFVRQPGETRKETDPKPYATEFVITPEDAEDLLSFAETLKTE